MLETRVPYRDEALDGAVFDGVVSLDPRAMRGPPFTPETTYRIDLHPRYATAGRTFVIVESGRALVSVERLDRTVR